MDLALTDEQELLIESLGELLERECPESYIANLDLTDQLPTTFRRSIPEAGFGAFGIWVSRLWRDLRGHRFGGGTNEIMVHIAGLQIAKYHS